MAARRAMPSKISAYVENSVLFAIGVSEFAVQNSARLHSIDMPFYMLGLHLSPLTFKIMCQIFTPASYNAFSPLSSKLEEFLSSNFPCYKKI